MKSKEEYLEEAYVKIRAAQSSSHEVVDPIILEAMEAYATQSKWVDVKDALPEEDQVVLAIGEGIRPSMSIYSAGWFYRFVDTVEGDNIIEIVYDKVKKWQPLPLPPSL